LAKSTEEVAMKAVVKCIFYRCSGMECKTVCMYLYNYVV
jgi:hypothetical protein